MHRVRCAEVWGDIRNYDEDMITSGITASLHSSSAAGVEGGDIYYFSVCESDLLTRIAVADVMGHGDTVSRTSRWMYEALVENMNTAGGDDVLGRLNRQTEGAHDQVMATAAVVAFYLNDNNLYFSSAGHPPVLIRRRGRRAWEEAVLPVHEGLANLPLGVASEALFDQGKLALGSGRSALPLHRRGDRGPDPQGKLFGLERLQTLLEDVGDEPLPEIKAAVLAGLRRHTGGDLAHDDVTIMVVEIR